MFHFLGDGQTQRNGTAAALDAVDFDAALVHSFIRAVGIYPSGSLVSLSNERLGVVREQLARVLALADRQLASVVPQEPAPTYGAGHRPTARIYRAAG